MIKYEEKRLESSQYQFRLKEIEVLKDQQQKENVQLKSCLQDI